MGILEPGIEMLEERIGKPVLGVLPYFTDINIDNEDSVCLDNSDRKLDNKNYKPSESKIDIVEIGRAHV